jgi:HEAT repeat protein
MQTLTRFGHLIGDERTVIMDLKANVSSPATWEVRHMAILSLIVAGVDEKKGPDERVTEALVQRAIAVNEPADQVRLEAIMALGAMGRPQAPKMLDYVVKNLRTRPENFNSRNKAIKMWTHVALMALEDKVYEKELAAIADNLKDEEAAIRSQAVACLGALEDKAHKYVPEICKMLANEKDNNVKIAAAQALGHMKTKGDTVITPLLKMMKEDSRDNVSVILAACAALASLQANTPDVLAAMNKVKTYGSLEKYQKDLVDKYIDEIEHPKKDLKDQPRSPEKKGPPGKIGK